MVWKRLLSMDQIAFIYRWHSSFIANSIFRNTCRWQSYCDMKQEVVARIAEMHFCLMIANTLELHCESRCLYTLRVLSFVKKKFHCVIWRSPPTVLHVAIWHMHRFCWQWEKAICCCLTLPLKQRKKMQSMNVRVCVCVWGTWKVADKQKTSHIRSLKFTFYPKWKKQLMEQFILLHVESVIYTFPMYFYFFWSSRKLPQYKHWKPGETASCYIYFTHLVFKVLETAALPVNDWPLWGECALTLLTLITADHKATGAVSPRLTLMESAGLCLKRQVNFFFVCCGRDSKHAGALFTQMGL